MLSKYYAVCLNYAHCRNVVGVSFIPGCEQPWNYWRQSPREGLQLDWQIFFLFFLAIQWHYKKIVELRMCNISIVNALEVPYRANSIRDQYSINCPRSNIWKSWDYGRGDRRIRTNRSTEDIGLLVNKTIQTCPTRQNRTETDVGCKQKQRL